MRTWLKNGLACVSVKIRVRNDRTGQEAGNRGAQACDIDAPVCVWQSAGYIRGAHMPKTTILSTGSPRPQHSISRAQAFDACHVGVVLRAVLFVELVVGVGALYTTHTLTDWVVRLALLTAGTLPATLAWLLLACAMKTWLDRLPLAGQYLAGAALGAVAGLFACGVLAAGLLGEPSASLPWLGAAVTGALMALLLVAALVLRARGRTPAAVTAQLAELQARIRPHFLFNTLNSAIALVRAEPARAEALLEDLSDLFRHALLDHGETTTLDQEIALARHYLAIEQVRFGDRLQVQWSIDPQAGSARLPPLLLQPLVENAVIHGVEPCAAPQVVRITTKRRGAIVGIEITNGMADAVAAHTSAPTPHHSPGHGMALANVHARLKLLHDVQAEFEAGARSDGSFRVRIRLPA
jgi:two-component system sensor histidine kinase AlgZ